MAKNSYVLGKRIARGGMAEIYMGKAIGEAAFQRICAIKRILPHYAQDKEFVEMFRDEAHICKRLQHANIVQVYDFTEVEGSYALIMEHVDGCDLRTLLSACEAAKTRLTVPMSLYIAANSARALHYAHTKSDEITKEPLGIVHRDISPQNILLSYEGEVKITDFGIASAENKITETRPGVVKGKYSYMSPEQVAAKPLDGRSDIFSLAIVLWESLAMKRLFAGQTEVESIRKVQNCEISHDLRELNGDVDEELFQIVMKGLAKERKLRYQSAAAFEKDLLRYLHSRYSDFTSSELGNFLKRILAKKRGKTQDDIKETLSQMQSSQQAPVHQATSLHTNVRADNLIDHGGTGIHRSTVQPVNANTGFQQPAVKSKPPRSFGNQKNQGTQRRGAIPHPVYRQSNFKRRRDGRMILLSLVAIIGVAIFFLTQNNPGDQKLHLKISTEPESILIAINGKKIHNGYTKTPAKISLKPGNYQIEFSRPGYQREVVKVRGKSGGTRNLQKVFLKRQAHSNLVPVKIIAPERKLFINIDNGLFRGATPMRVELTPGAKHSITFNSGDRQKKVLKCTFRTVRPPKGKQLTVLIRPSKQGKARCTIR
ncbi:serine/threonine-protein kinase [Pseudobacteriovorax antillogorgiicola]|uniref:non-specific serine/threonine protein kinase n=1 Tax=Pseudobacteriovorax antillogorgiicola TaxID=1513793 RepID=A0A1Y6B8F5_9BACT|nr:serine/threonine-protein kinase [Pseudobacteriovorax antillogorgiicola]TCS58857.1 serine/threonine protein kinase [Pseudobacteriovorax antillogorgiicola]SME93979.1 Serine/threonine protein kinase [Pseudobacteriovorax antillogorgiicola]